MNELNYSVFSGLDCASQRYDTSLSMQTLGEVAEGKRSERTRCDVRQSQTSSLPSFRIDWIRF